MYTRSQSRRISLPINYSGNAFNDGAQQTDAPSSELPQDCPADEPRELPSGDKTDTRQGISSLLGNIGSEELLILALILLLSDSKGNEDVILMLLLLLVIK